MNNHFRTVSFNCNGVKNKIPVIKSLCDHSDVVFLQETWLKEDELNFLNNVHSNFDSFSLSSMNIHDNILIGRPYGGISIMWNRAHSPCCNIVQYEDKRLLCISISFNDFNYLFLNVYLPYFYIHNVDAYDMYMGKIASILDGSDATGVVIIGDFNAGPANSFFEELQILCHEKDLIISDVVCLPQDTFTHVNHGTNTKSWLDHCVCSQPMHERLSSIYVDDNYSGSDHLPLYANFNFNVLKDFENISEAQEKIKWIFNDDNLCATFYAILWQRLNYDPQHPACSCRGRCQDAEHLQYLESLWSHFVQTAQAVGREVFGTIRNNNRCIPGWNDFIKDFYAESREAFKAWKDSGCPRFGPVACYMRSSRANFKYVLRQCKLYEEDMRAMALSNKLQGGEIVPYWREIQSLSGSKRTCLPGRVDDAVGWETISSLWKEKFNSVLNSVDDLEDMREFFMKRATLPEVPVASVSVAEVQRIVKDLKNGKAVGMDLIPNEFFKYASQNILIFISITFNSFLVHSFLPVLLMSVLIVPLLKGKYRDPSKSANYRPIAIATAASKIFEKLIYERMKIGCTQLITNLALNRSIQLTCVFTR